MLSNESVRVLSAFRENTEFTEDRLPADVNLSLLRNLIDEGAIKENWLLPPGRESDYPHGLRIYQLTSLGHEILCQFDERSKKEAKQNAKENRRAFWSAIKFWVGLILGWILGGFTPQEVFGWLVEFFR